MEAKTMVDKRMAVKKRAVAAAAAAATVVKMAGKGAIKKMVEMRVVTVTVTQIAMKKAVAANEVLIKNIGRRLRRGYNNSGYGGGYTRGSDERDASTSNESGNGCSSENTRNYSGSRELAYNRDGRQSNDNARGTRSFAKASASAVASSFSQNLKTKNVS
ncbi:uncharacterized protein LOC131851870 [Achroia grisella]|uniref:uncharacterized protein LOC131851870 n=1 Tax=Achroia grisella TaxID=688607 RepID=UPI0027D281F2|nr:uncharacterized protein LOC131851870 [Achroia grisella]